MTTAIETAEKIDAHCISIDETHHYLIDPADAPFIAQIRGIYLFDRNQRTHCCEFTPSYYLIHLYDQVTPSEAGAKLDEEAMSELYDKYEHEDSEDRYFHCHNIDALIGKAGRFEHLAYGNPGVSYEDVGYDEQMDGLREHFCGNCPF